MSNKLMAIVEDEEKVAEILETARTSMGMDISDLDLMNIERYGHSIVVTTIFVFHHDYKSLSYSRFATRVASLSEYRQRLHEYIKDRMGACAPSLCALIGEQVSAYFFNM